MSCKYCNQPENKLKASCLVCSDCNQLVHITCLKRKGTPGAIPGDVYFNFTCSECSPSGEENFRRESNSWFQTIVLTFFDLIEKSSGTDRHGFYHWKYHISSYIEKNWKILFREDFKKKKNWFGTISGSLSSYSPLFFKSGTEVFNEQGWWKLSHPYLSPELTINLQAAMVQQKTKFKDKRKKCTDLQQTKSNKSKTEALIFEELFAEIKTKYGIENISNDEPPLKKHKTNESTTSPSKIQNSVKNISEILESTSNETIDESIFETLSAENANATSFVHDFDLFGDDVDVLNDDESSEEMKSGNMSRRSSVSNNSVDDEKSVESDDQLYITELLLEKSLFKVSEKKTDKDPWEEEEAELDSKTDENIQPMTTYEEFQLLTKLESVASQLPKNIYRTYVKLRLRDTKRKLNLPVFNFDNTVRRLNEKSSITNSYSKYLDRYQRPTVLLSGAVRWNNESSFSSRILGCTEHAVFCSPYTNRVLKPFIRRDYESKPLWLRLMNELKMKVNKKFDPNYEIVDAPIDYCYVRLHHIPAINSLCEQFFWPGIDMTEALQYPDFSCVVLYKKLIIGFAFLTPDISYNESYISFIFTRPEWRRAGIATFMLYHLIQTCMGKDITLHVSPTNPAVILYQKFNFKVEEFIQDFYDKYMGLDNRDCKHALFLRLSR